MAMNRQWQPLEEHTQAERSLTPSTPWAKALNTVGCHERRYWVSQSRIRLIKIGYTSNSHPAYGFVWALRDVVSVFTWLWRKLTPRVERISVDIHSQTSAATAVVPNLCKPCGHRNINQTLARTGILDKISPQAPWSAVAYLPGITPLMSLSGLTQFFCVMYRINFFADSNCWVAISHRRDSGNILQRHKGNTWMASILSILFHFNYVSSGKSGWILVSHDDLTPAFPAHESH